MRYITAIICSCLLFLGACDSFVPDEERGGTVVNVAPSPAPNVTVEGDTINVIDDDDTDGYWEACTGPDCASGLIMVGPVALRGGDCDGNRSDVNPGAPETCDSRDNDCNGTVDDVPGGCPGLCGNGVVEGVEECDGGA